MCSCAGKLRTYACDFFTGSGPLDELEPADRLRVLDELRRRHVDPVEERPPDGLALAVVVVEELRGQLLTRVEQLLAKRRALNLHVRHRLRHLRLGQRERPELRESLRTPLEQPVAQQERRDAVLPVVRVDLVEQRLLARLHPLLEDDDRGAAVLHLGLSLEVEEVLELLQPVAGPRGANAVADDFVEVDEDAAPKQVVELRLARAVAAHEALERGDLVGGVVVDVQLRGARGAARARGR